MNHTASPSDSNRLTADPNRLTAFDRAVTPPITIPTRTAPAPTPTRSAGLKRSPLRERYRPQRSNLPRWIAAAAILHGFVLLWVLL